MFWVQVTMATIGALGFILVCAGAGINMGSATNNLSDTDMQGERYERVSKSTVAEVLYKTGGVFLVISFVMAVYIQQVT